MMCKCEEPEEVDIAGLFICRECGGEIVYEDLLED